MSTFALYTIMLSCWKNFPSGNIQLLPYAEGVSTQARSPPPRGCCANARPFDALRYAEGRLSGSGARDDILRGGRITLRAGAHTSTGSVDGGKPAACCLRLMGILAQDLFHCFAFGEFIDEFVQIADFPHQRIGDLLQRARRTQRQ